MSYNKDLIESKIFQIEIPVHWVEDKRESRSLECRLISLDVCNQLFYKCDLLPDIIATSVESGIYLKYNLSSYLSLIIEIYNENLEMVYLINDDKNKDIILAKSFECIEDIGLICQ